MDLLTRQGIPTWRHSDLGIREIDPVAVTLALGALRGRGGLRPARQPALLHRGPCCLPTLMRHLRRVLMPPAQRAPFTRGARPR